jgi:hypothetical protein
MKKQTITIEIPIQLYREIKKDIEFNQGRRVNKKEVEAVIIADLSKMG